MRAVAVDIEAGRGHVGDALDWQARILCVSVAYRDDEGTLVTDSINLGMADLFTQPSTIPQGVFWLRRHLEGADWVIFHNGSYDIPYLIRDGLIEKRHVRGRTFDTLLMARCTGPHDKVGLEPLCREFGIRQSDEEWYRYMKGQRAHLDKKDPGMVMRYAEADTANTLLLFERLYPLAMEQYTEEWIRKEGNFVCLVSEMRVRGLGIDLQRVGDLRVEKRAELDKIARRLGYAGLKGPNDNAGLLRYLRRFPGEGLTNLLKLTDKGNTSVDEEGLLNVTGVKIWSDHLNNPDDRMDDETAAKFEMLYPWVDVVCDVLRGRELAKQISTWLEGYLEVADEQGRVHALYGAGGTVSYRLNCTHPNVQAVPKKLGLWGSRPGYRLVEFDLSQAELRLGAAAAGETLMAQAFFRGEDIHQATAVQMYGPTADKSKRRFAKTANFGGFYGGGAPAIDRALMCGLAMAEEIVSKWRSTYRMVRKTSKDAERVWASRGYLILAHGKRLYATEDDIARRIYKAYNQFVQGSIAEIIKTAMLHLDEHHPEILIVGQIHDSLLIEIPEDLVVQMVAIVLQVMEDAAPVKYMHKTDPPIRMMVDFHIYGEKDD